MHVWDFLPEFAKALQAQLEEDEKEWGNAWLRVNPNGMVERIQHHVGDYILAAESGGKPVPWLKVAGYAVIAWIRQNHPELWKSEE